MLQMTPDLFLQRHLQDKTGNTSSAKSQSLSLRPVVCVSPSLSTFPPPTVALSPENIGSYRGDFPEAAARCGLWSNKQGEMVHVSGTLWSTGLVTNQRQLEFSWSLCNFRCWNSNSDPWVKDVAKVCFTFTVHSVSGCFTRVSRGKD